MTYASHFCDCHVTEQEWVNIAIAQLVSRLYCKDYGMKRQRQQNLRSYFNKRRAQDSSKFNIKSLTEDYEYIIVIKLIHMCTPLLKNLATGLVCIQWNPSDTIIWLGPML